MAKQPTVVIEDATILFPNFAGTETTYNKTGKREFNIKLTEDEAEELALDGWNVKRLNPRDDEEVGTPILPVEARYDMKPPRITTITGDNNQTNLSEDTVDILDYAEIAKVDLVIRAYDWEVNEKSGRKAYLKSMFVTIDEDPLEAKYNQSTSKAPARAPEFEDDEEED